MVIILIPVQKCASQFVKRNNGCELIIKNAGFHFEQFLYIQ
jgi:hypothetical protein